MENLSDYIQVVQGLKEADLIVKNGRIVNTASHRIIEGKDLLIYDGKIMGIGHFDNAKEVIDAKGQYIVPGLIEAHVHIESSLLAPHEFGKVLIRQGVTTIVNDPHEIANVLGKAGIHFIDEVQKQIPLNTYTMFPSSVPATPFETSGATLTSQDEAELFAEGTIFGLAEVMNTAALKAGDDELLAKIKQAIEHTNHLDGHAAGIKGNDLNLYPLCHIMNDHEAATIEEAQDRLDLGMYLMIREGTIAKNLDTLCHVITTENARHIILVTDDKHVDDLYEEGSVNHSIRRLIHKGLDPLTCIQMATINPSECYGMKKGAFIPGYDADFFFCQHLDELKPTDVYIKGECVVQSGQICYEEDQRVLQQLMDDIVKKSQITLPEELDLTLPLTKKQPPIIQLIPNRLETNVLYEEVKRDEAGCFISDTEQDLLKIVVVERHKQTGNIGKGIIRGFELKEGAIATSISHDSHNIVCVGTNDADMSFAIRQIEEMNGGIVVVKDGKVLASLILPLAGLMSLEPVEAVVSELKDLEQAALNIGAPETFNPFLTLSFLTLPVIPQIKITDHGVFLFDAFQTITL